MTPSSTGLPLTRPSNMPASSTGPGPYELAVEHENKCWNALHSLKREDVRYADALVQWRAAADAIGVAAEMLLPRAGKPLIKAPVKRALRLRSRTSRSGAGG